MALSSLKTSTNWSIVLILVLSDRLAIVLNSAHWSLNHDTLLCWIIEEFNHLQADTKSMRHLFMLSLGYKIGKNAEKDFDQLIINIFFLPLTLSYNQVSAQNTRLNTYNNIGWFNYFGTFRFFPQNLDYIQNINSAERSYSRLQQSLLRVGLNYQPERQITITNRLCHGNLPLRRHPD